MKIGIAVCSCVGVFALAGVALGQVPRIPSYADHANLMVVNGPAEATSRPVTSAADWRVRRDHILGHLQEVTGPMPGGERRVLLDLRVEQEFDEPAYTRRKISYASEPGDRVPAWLLVPKGVAKNRPAALCLHQTVSIGKDEPVGLGGRVTLRYGKELAERGFVVLAPDYPGFGEHQVDVYELGYQSATMKAVWDNMRGVDLLLSMPEVDPAKVVAIGHSLGGHNAIYTSTFDERISAVVSSCGFNSFPFYYEGNLTGWSHRGYMPRIASVYGKDPARLPFDFPELIGALAPRGFFTNSPLQDQNFEVEGVKVCLEAARPVYRLLRAENRLRAQFPASGHDFPDEQRTAAYGFLDEMVGWKGNSGPSSGPSR